MGCDEDFTHIYAELFLPKAYLKRSSPIGAISRTKFLMQTFIISGNGPTRRQMEHRYEEEGISLPMNLAWAGEGRVFFFKALKSGRV